MGGVIFMLQAGITMGLEVPPTGPLHSHTTHTCVARSYDRRGVANTV